MLISERLPELIRRPLPPLHGIRSDRFHIGPPGHWQRPPHGAVQRLLRRLRGCQPGYGGRGHPQRVPPPG